MRGRWPAWIVMALVATGCTDAPPSDDSPPAPGASDPQPSANATVPFETPAHVDPPLNKTEPTLRFSNCAYYYFGPDAVYPGPPPGELPPEWEETPIHGYEFTMIDCARANYGVHERPLRVVLEYFAGGNIEPGPCDPPAGRLSGILRRVWISDAEVEAQLRTHLPTQATNITVEEGAIGTTWTWGAGTNVSLAKVDASPEGTSGRELRLFWWNGTTAFLDTTMEFRGGTMDYVALPGGRLGSDMAHPGISATPVGGRLGSLVDVRFDWRWNECSSGPT